MNTRGLFVSAVIGVLSVGALPALAQRGMGPVERAAGRHRPAPVDGSGRRGLGVRHCDQAWVIRMVEHSGVA
jgi:hypothetical protein